MEVVKEISVVIPAYNAAGCIERCLAALAEQTLSRERYEVVVVDDASTDDTAARAEAAGARVVKLPVTSGPGGARNAGIEAAAGELIVFTDADCEPVPGFLEHLVSPLLDDPEVGGSKGTYLSRQSELVARFVQHEYEQRYRHTAKQEWLDFVDTYAACFRRADLLEVGGFDARFRQCQDQELSFRLATAGVKICFVAGAQTYHTHASGLWSYARKKFGIARWKVQVLQRHPQKLVRDSHTPQSLKVEMVASAAALAASCAAVGCALAGWSTLAYGAGATAVGSVAIFTLLVTPFIASAWRKDKALALGSLPILVVRDLALAIGLVCGILWPPKPPPALRSATRG